MHTRTLVILSLLVGIGTILHAIVPPILFGMKPDMSLAMMFLGIMMFPKLQYVMLVATVTGFISALTTSFPLGQILNIIEKPITGLIFFALFLLMGNLLQQHLRVAILTAIGTMISGSLFLLIAFLIASIDLEVGFIYLLTVNVIPASIVNTIAVTIIHPVIQNIMKKAKLVTSYS